MAQKKNSFEEKMKRLEEIADLLSSGNLSLDESIKLYNESKELSKELKDIIENAKKNAENSEISN